MGIYFADSSCKSNQYTEASRACGLKWVKIGETRPEQGTELTNAGLKAALENQFEFTQEEWDAFGISDLLMDDFIQSKGAYFKPAWSSRTFLLCRVIMGWPYCTKESHVKDRRAPNNPAFDGKPFDSIFAESGVANGGRQQHNEFVIFDKWQVYPEFLVQFAI